jgi:uncharacterized RDD family membrane protein YckC
VSTAKSTAIVDAERRLGQYAGAPTRLVALALDIGIMWGLFSLGFLALNLAVQLLSNTKLTFSTGKVGWAVAVAVWQFVYFAYQWALGGRTIADAFFGLRVVSKDGARIGVKTACIRSLFLFVSLAFIVLVGIAMLIQRERRALHDLVAGTAVVYDWDARAARLRWLATQEPRDRGGQPAPPSPVAAPPG